jgi:hypothetical protein
VLQGRLVLTSTVPNQIVGGIKLSGGPVVIDDDSTLTMAHGVVTDGLEIQSISSSKAAIVVKVYIY